MSILGFFVLVLLGLMAVAALSGLVLLVVNPKTRAIGAVLLVVPVLIVLLLVPFFWLRTSSVRQTAVAVEHQVRAEQERARTVAERKRLESKTVASQDAIEDAGAKPLPAEAPDTTADTGPGTTAVAKATAAPPAATPRPQWTESPPQRINGVFQMSVRTDPYVTATECQARLPEEFYRAVGEYIQNVYLAHMPAKDSVRITLPLDFIRGHVVQEEFTETLDSSVGPMVRVHARLEFDREANERIDEAWTKLLVGRRMWVTGAGLSGVLVLLSVVWGYLRIDLATGGAYRGRLRILAALGILALLAIGIAFTG